MSIHLSSSLFLYLPVYKLSINQSIYLSPLPMHVYLSVYLPIYTYASKHLFYLYLSIPLPTHASLSIHSVLKHLHTSSFICLHICLSACLVLYLSVFSSIHLYMSLCLSVSLSLMHLSIFLYAAPFYLSKTCIYPLSLFKIKTLWSSACESVSSHIKNLCQDIQCSQTIKRKRVLEQNKKEYAWPLA